MYSQCVFPLVFPLQVRNILDVLFHAVSAGLFHLIGHMSIYVQRESRCSVSKISLYGFNVVTRLYIRGE